MALYSGLFSLFWTIRGRFLEFNSVLRAGWRFRKQAEFSFESKIISVGLYSTYLKCSQRPIPSRGLRGEKKGMEGTFTFVYKWNPTPPLFPFDIIWIFCLLNEPCVHYILSNQTIFGRVKVSCWHDGSYYQRRIMIDIVEKNERMLVLDYKQTIVCNCWCAVRWDAGAGVGAYEEVYKREGV